jgi:TonB-dependent SusC/RagA subfamily outer membrane receptor
MSIPAIAQNLTVTGKVSDENNQPLAAATVQEKGTSHGVITGPDGSFSISVKSNKSVLLISSVGFESVEVSASSNDLRVSLKVDTKSLNEVVVTGVGVATSKKKLGISVESIGSDKLPATPTASIDQALIGKIPGAQISTVSGNPGDPVNIVLRGINTVQGGTFPIVLLDGVQVGATNLNSLDLNNIDRVEVVQGAASAAIYGAQGANGVIQIFY